MPLILGANSLAGGGYEIDNSLRFNDDSSDYLNKTFGSAGNRKTWTFSAWIKRSNLITSRIFCTLASGVDDFIKFDTSHRIEWGFDHEDLSNRGKLITNRVFRDVSAWYHIVCAVDTTNATAGNRMRIYINGVEETSFATDTNPTQNEDGEILNANPHFLSSTSSAQFYDGYMADVYMIGGQQLTPSDFGEFDSDTGIWKPIAYTGTYGTNGFYLEFKDSSALGDDTSGEGNDFTVNNLTSIDQTTDTPTNNFATMNPLSIIGGDPTLSEGNLKTTTATSGWRSSVSTLGLNTGKWYWEMKIGSITGSNYNMVGIISDNLISSLSTTYIGSGTYSYAMNYDGQKYINNTNTAYGSAMTTGNIVMCAMDLINNYFYVGINEIWQNSGVPTSGASGTGALSAIQTGYYYFPAVSVHNSTNEINFGNAPYTITTGNADANGYGNFEYTVPTGYYALNTKNLAEYG
jgi:hypothetical protein